MKRLLISVTLFYSGIGAALADEPSRTIGSVLDAWHAAAAKADETEYFKHFAKRAVFLGTDATERWDREAFQKFAHPYFAKGKAWSFKGRDRKIDFSEDGKTAWFDELLDTEKMGLCRGSGVLILESGVWKIAQYNLSTPIPNDVFPKVKELIEGAAKKK